MPVDRSFFAPFLRGHALVALGLYLLPVAILVVLGLVWLGENGWLLVFVLATVLVIGLFRIGSALLRRLARARARANAAATDVADAVAPSIDANPDWTAEELAVFRRLVADIAAEVAEPVPWPTLQPLAVEVVKKAADALSAGTRDALDFSVPEALLLCDRVITRVRMDLRTYVPFADTISIGSLWWAWSNRAVFQHGANVAQKLWRLKRVIVNPPAGIMQEVQGLLLGDSAGVLKSTGISSIQRMLLEEVARAAIDLHSGRLRFSDAELLQIELASQRTDDSTRRAEDAPLRVLVVGQVSAGKTSLINALAGEDLGEIDMAPTTPGLVSHTIELAASSYTFVDSEGIDGSDAVAARLLEELMQADMVLWVIRANRPARAPDQQLLVRMRAEFAARKMRRAPRVIVVVTGTDLLLAGWPFPEHVLPAPAMEQLGEILKAVRRDLQEDIVVPVSTQPPEWNIAQLETLIAQGAGEALAVQRNRRRIEGEATLRRVGVDAGRTVRGMLQLGRMAVRGFRR